jgi:hypothetical protein
VGGRSRGRYATPAGFPPVVPRAGSYTYDVGVWDLSIVQGSFSVAPYQTLELRFASGELLVSLTGAAAAGEPAAACPAATHRPAEGVDVWAFE